MEHAGGLLADLLGGVAVIQEQLLLTVGEGRFPEELLPKGYFTDVLNPHSAGNIIQR